MSLLTSSHLLHTCIDPVENFPQVTRTGVWDAVWCREVGHRQLSGWTLCKKFGKIVLVFTLEDTVPTRTRVAVVVSDVLRTTASDDLVFVSVGLRDAMCEAGLDNRGAFVHPGGIHAAFRC